VTSTSLRGVLLDVEVLVAVVFAGVGVDGAGVVGLAPQELMATINPTRTIKSIPFLIIFSPRSLWFFNTGLNFLKHKVPAQLIDFGFCQTT